MRSKTGTRILWVDSDIASFKAIMKALKSQHPVGFVFDQKSKNRKGPQVEFFGFSIQSNYLNYEGKDSDVNVLTQFLASQLEHKVKEHPFQWLWHYHKWTKFS